MEKPSIVELFEPQIKYEISQTAEKGEKLDYYSYFIDFLEEQKQITLVHGNVVGAVRSKQIFKYNNASSPFGIEQIDYGIKYLKYMQKLENGSKIVEQGTARQTSLAFYYMQRAMAFPRKTGNNTKDAEFIRFLSGSGLDTIRKILGNPLRRSNDKTGKATKELIKDLTVILNQFESIQFQKGVECVENDIKTLQNDLESFKEI